MRTLRKNKQKMKYCLPGQKVQRYETDDDGNIKYIEVDGVEVPIKVGEPILSYGEPVDFKGCISSQLENAIVRAWGSDNSNNYAVLVVDKNALPKLVNGTRIWRKSSIVRDEYGLIDGNSADYMVAGVLDEELNEDSYYLQKLDGGNNSGGDDGKEDI